MSLPDRCSMVPREAFSYWPTGALTCREERNCTIRFIFYRVEYTTTEKAELEAFKMYISKNYSGELCSFFQDPELLRLLIANKFDKKKALAGLIHSSEWRKTNLSDGSMGLLSKCEHLLQSGCIYIHGRDHRYRPLIILNVSKMKLDDSSLEEHTNLLCFVLEFAIEHLMVPGQIENWLIITDLCNTPVSKIKLTGLKKIIKVLQDNYRCRMIVNYVINTPSSISFFWKLAKHIIDPLTVQKIKIQKSPVPEGIFELFAKNQIEEKYGGTAPNLEAFWPPVMPVAPYHIAGTDPSAHLSSISSYYEYFPEKRPKSTETTIQSIPSEYEEGMSVIKYCERREPEFEELNYQGNEQENTCENHNSDQMPITPVELCSDRYIDSPEHEKSFHTLNISESPTAEDTINPVPKRQSFLRKWLCLCRNPVK